MTAVPKYIRVGENDLPNFFERLGSARGIIVAHSKETIPIGLKLDQILLDPRHARPLGNLASVVAGEATHLFPDQAVTMQPLWIGFFQPLEGELSLRYKVANVKESLLDGWQPLQLNGQALLCFMPE